MGRCQRAMLGLLQDLIETADAIGNKNGPLNNQLEEAYEKRLKVTHLVVRCSCACGFTLQSPLKLRLAAVQCMCAFQLCILLVFQLALAYHDRFRGSRCCKCSCAQMHADLCGELHKPQVDDAALCKAATGAQVSPKVDGSEHQKSSQGIQYPRYFCRCGSFVCSCRQPQQLLLASLEQPIIAAAQQRQPCCQQTSSAHSVPYAHSSTLKCTAQIS